jgi:hypothetical protein
MPHINGDQWAAAFLAREPDYTLAGWIDAYKKVFSGCMPDPAPVKSRRRLGLPLLSQVAGVINLGPSLSCSVVARTPR